MVVGFNHNFRYQGEVYHIQTEDSGVKSPNIVTLLYQGGTILASKKTSYADIARIDNLEQVVEELMKEQHKNMLRSLKAGEFDEVIARFKAGKKVTPQMTEGELPAAHPVPVETPDRQDEPQDVAGPAPTLPPGGTPEKTPSPVPEKPAEKPKQQRPATIEASLDEVILSYLMGDEK